jgi:hypothetical protein
MLSTATDHPARRFFICNVGGLSAAGDCVTHAANIIAAGYEFEGGPVPFS